MKFAADFRRIARDSLRGKWFIAVMAGLIASLLCGTSGIGPKVNINYETDQLNFDLSVAGQEIFSTSGNFSVPAVIAGIGITYLIIAAVVFAIASFIIRSIISVGYSRFNLDVVDGYERTEVGTLFGYFSFWKTVSAAYLLQSIYIMLWSFLFIIPGIVAIYSYSMTGYILAENPHLSASEAIARSKQMMYGNRWRLFCLSFSFIGWTLLSAILTLGIGELWLVPYRETAVAAFYREISASKMYTNEMSDM